VELINDRVIRNRELLHICAYCAKLIGSEEHFSFGTFKMKVKINMFEHYFKTRDPFLVHNAGSVNSVLPNHHAYKSTTDYS
jgi:hypothetical protein